MLAESKISPLERVFFSRGPRSILALIRETNGIELGREISHLASRGVCAYA